MELFQKQKAEYKLIRGDAFDLIHSLQNNSVNLTITSPPYNVGKVYEKRVKLAEYLKPYRDFASALFEKTSLAGHLCWEVGNYVQESEVFPLDVFFYDIFKNAGFQLRNRIVWHFEHGLHASKRFSGRYETILWFSKSDQYTFNLDDVRVPSKYPGKRSWKGKDRGKPSGNPLGKNPSDLWKIVQQDWESEIWEIPNVKANHPEKTIHPCQFPIELVQRCVLALTSEGDVVLDPFLGVGSSCIGAVMHDRKFIGFEMDNTFIEHSEKRIKAYLAGSLKIRPLGKLVYQPTGNEKVSKIPAEWKDLLCK